MKILYIIHQFYPTHHAGTEKFLLNLATTMQKWGHKVRVLTYDYSPDGVPPLESTLRSYLYKGIDILAIRDPRPTSDLHYRIGDPRFTGLAESVLREESPDLLHIAHSMRLSEFVLAAGRLSIPYLVTMTDFFLMCPRCTLFTEKRTLCMGPEHGEACAVSCQSYPSDVIRERLKAGKIILLNAAKLVAPSRFLGHLFKREFPFIAPRVIPYGIDYNRIKVNRRKYTGTEDFVILFAGQLDFHKGVHVLIDAVRRVKAGNLRLKIYGAGPLAAVRHFKDQASHDSRIEFCGVYGEDVIGDVFSQADVIAIPSMWHENNTIVMREAIASHLPALVSNAGGMVEKIRDGYNGFVFRMGDSQDLQRVIEQLLSNPELLTRVRNNLLRSTLISVEQEAFAYEQEYQQILSSPHKGGMISDPAA